ncbi:MAG: hypothetical protein PHO02_01530 [Candidatus Nanoarchaeia archaeon]|nr:hypothetical protein [Candidatus Nanoarchaeia archaeon]
MKALKAITIGTSALALIPLVSAADGGLISEGVEVLFGASTGGGIFTKLGLFIILFAFLSLGAKKAFPEEHSRMGTLVAAILALIGMKFMPEVWIAGLGTLIWVAALALLPYAIVTIFLKEGTKKKWIFVVLAYAVLLFVVFQMKGFPSFARSVGLRGEFWEDMSYKFGAIGHYWYVWIIAAALVALFVWLFTRKGKGGDDLGGGGSTGGKGDKGPGLFKRGLEGLGKGIAAPFKLLNKAVNGLADFVPKAAGKAINLGGKALGLGGKAIKGVGKGIVGAKDGIKNFYNDRKLTPEERERRRAERDRKRKANRELKEEAKRLKLQEKEANIKEKQRLKEEERLRKEQETLRTKEKEALKQKQQKQFEHKQLAPGSKEAIEASKRERIIAEEANLRREAELKRMTEEAAKEKWSKTKEMTEEERLAFFRAEAEKKMQQAIKEKMKTPEGRRELHGEEFNIGGKQAEAERRIAIEKLSREELIKKYNEINENPIDEHDFDKHFYREKLWKEIQNRERILAEERRIAEQRSIADKIKESGRNVMEKMHLLPPHAGPSGETVTGREIDLRQKKEEIERLRRIEKERVLQEEARLRERGASEAEIEKFKRLALEKQEREIMRLEIAQKAAEHTEQMAREAKIKNEEKSNLRRREEESAYEERERELAAQKAEQEHVGWLERIGLRRRETEEQMLQRIKKEEELRLKGEERLALQRKQEEQMWKEREAQQNAEQKELALREEAERKAELKAERLAEEREREAAARAKKAKIEAERETMARQRREEEAIRKKEGRILQNERKIAKSAAAKRGRKR